MLLSIDYWSNLRLRRESKKSKKWGTKNTCRQVSIFGFFHFLSRIIFKPNLIGYDKIDAYK